MVAPEEPADLDRREPAALQLERARAATRHDRARAAGRENVVERRVPLVADRAHDIEEAARAEPLGEVGRRRHGSPFAAGRGTETTSIAIACGAPFSRRIIAWS